LKQVSQKVESAPQEAESQKDSEEKEPVLIKVVDNPSVDSSDASTDSATAKTNKTKAQDTVDNFTRKIVKKYLAFKDSHGLDIANQYIEERKAIGYLPKAFNIKDYVE
jgi:hypothetical protein